MSGGGSANADALLSVSHGLQWTGLQSFNDKLLRMVAYRVRIRAFRRVRLRRYLVAKANETIHANELDIELALGE